MHVRFLGEETAARPSPYPTLLRAVAEQGYAAPTPIQTQAIPAILDGRDVLAAAQTGTAKPVKISCFPPSSPRTSGGSRRDSCIGCCTSKWRRAMRRPSWSVRPSITCRRRKADIARASSQQRAPGPDPGVHPHQARCQQTGGTVRPGWFSGRRDPRQLEPVCQDASSG